MKEIQKDSAFEKFEKITVQGDERIGKLLRASQSLLKEDPAVERKNLYLEYAPQFVYPLIQEKVEGLHLDFTVFKFPILFFNFCLIFLEKRRCDIFGTIINNRWNFGWICSKCSYHCSDDTKFTAIH